MIVKSAVKLISNRTCILIYTGFLFTGCSSIENPMTVKVGPKDSLVYDAGMERTQRLKTTQYTVDVFVDCDNVVLNSQGNAVSAREARALLASQIDGVLRSKLQKFPFFRVTAGDSLMKKVRSRRMENDADAGIAPRLEQRERADYTILARIDTVYTHGDGSVGTATTLGGSGAIVAGIEDNSTEKSAIGGMIAGLATTFEPNVVEVSMTFEFYDNAKGRTIHTENIEGVWAGQSKHNTGSMILRAARECVSSYSEILAREYGQESRVLATRGNGEYAWISLGTKDGVAAGTHVMFYGFTDAGDIIESWNRIEEPVAYGVVIGVPDENTCWTRVEQHNSVSVCKYHYVKIISVPKSTGFLNRIGVEL